MTKLFTESGDEVEVPSEEELKELKVKAEKSGKVDELGKILIGLRETLGITDKDDLAEAVKLSKESANPNWAKARTAMAKMKKFIESTEGTTVDESGEVKKPDEQQMTPEEVEKSGRSAARKEIFEQEIESRLSKYPEEKRAVAKKYFEKLTQGEDMSMELINSGFKEAETLTFGAEGSPSTAPVDGGVPNIGGDTKDDFADSSQGKQAGEAMGLRSNHPDAKPIDKPADGGGEGNK